MDIRLQCNCEKCGKGCDAVDIEVKHDAKALVLVIQCHGDIDSAMIPLASVAAENTPHYTLTAFRTIGGRETPGAVITHIGKLVPATPENPGAFIQQQNKPQSTNRQYDL